jgi:hypothetical protein
VTLGALLATAGGAGAHDLELQSLLSGQQLGSAPAGIVQPSGCPSWTDPAAFTSVDQLYRMNEVEARFGPRPTASPAHTAFIDWLQTKMAGLAGMQLGSITYGLNRQTETGASLTLNDKSPTGVRIPIASIVPYSRATAPVTAPLVYVPSGTDLSTADIRGKIVVRDFPPPSVPYAVFEALSWWSWDPNLKLTQEIGNNYTREYLSTQRETDLTAAAAGGAAGLVFVHELPTEQVRGIYAPYDGIYWGVPAVYVGVDEGQQLEHAAAAGRTATLELSAKQASATTRMLIDTLPGVSPERLIVSSHTDGMNAVWDNGPIAMLAIAKYYASLPLSCRPRTMQFVFTTGHLFQALGGPGTHDGSARIEAEQLDKDYENGTVAAVMTVEHLGARGYEAVPRSGGLPGDTLVPTGDHETNAFFFGDSPAISESVLAAVVRDKLTETIALQGADLPAAHIPIHQSFGGEGGPYHQRLIPTIAFVTGPWTLFGTAYSTNQILDKNLMHQQTLVFTDILHRIEYLPRQVIAGGYLAERQARSVACLSAFTPLGLANCQGVPSPAGSAQWMGVASPQWAATLGRLEAVH